MVSVGIDLSAQAKDTAACWVRWGTSGAQIERVEHEVDDSRLIAVLTERADKIGIDVPLGWPDDFVDSVDRHHAGRPFGHSEMQRLTRRETDRYVWNRHSQLPLSVTTDRIAYPAMRAARILGALPGSPIDRSGDGAIVEVYPAVALRVWRLQHQRYKGKTGRDLLKVILGELRGRCTWLTASDTVWHEVAKTDHAFDALVCSLVARTHYIGRCDAVPNEFREAARREGWIAVPVEGSLEQLTTDSAGESLPGC